MNFNWRGKKPCEDIKCFFFSFIYRHECLHKAAALVFMVSYTSTPINSSFYFCKINKESCCGSTIKNQECGLERCLETR